MAEILTRERRGAVTVLTLNRPEVHNALSIELRDRLTDTLTGLAGDHDCTVVVITGAGSTFCSGFDLTEFDAAMRDEVLATRLWASSDRYHDAVLRFPLPTVAAVNGPAIAGGFDLAVMCDLRVADPAARFTHPEYTFGDVVYGPLADLVGGSVARDLCLTGRSVDAAEAHRMGLVNRLSPPGAALDTALEVAEQIARAPRELVSRTKMKAVRHGNTTGSETLAL